MIYDSRACTLGEGPLWHPLRRQFFWFDILNNKLLSRQGETPLEWAFGERVSAAGWVGAAELLIASETGLYRFNLDTSAVQPLAALEADKPETRSNDGRADPFGGFWIGTMGKKAQRGAGAIYRFYKGELRKLYPNISIPNSLCFAPDGRTAYFSDSATRQTMRVALDAEGWPLGQPELFLDHTGHVPEPDGAVTDAEGRLWLAFWNGARVNCYAPDGNLLSSVTVDAPQATCPAFGGEGLETLFCTSAFDGMDAARRAAHPSAGMTFAFAGMGRGRAEAQVLL